MTLRSASQTLPRDSPKAPHVIGLTMGRCVETVEFQAPLDRVWKLFTDPADWLKWNGEWSAIRDVRGPFDHAGAGYTQVMRFLGREWLGRWEVLACEPGVSREIERPVRLEEGRYETREIRELDEFWVTHAALSERHG